MTGRSDLDRTLSAYLEARATSRAPAGLLGTALGQIEATNQRSGWLVPDRWLSAAATVRLARVRRGSVRVAFAALLIAIAAAVVLMVGSQRRLPPPFGLAKAGLIAFVSSGHVFTMNVDGMERRQLTFGQGSDFRPTWSPDGTRIAYLSATGLGCPKEPCLNESTALMVIAADGGQPITIADGLATSGMGQIAWSPDSRRVAYTATPSAAPFSLSHLYVAEADGSNTSQIGGAALAAFEPAWSPKGTQIAFMSLKPTPGLWLIDPDGSDAHPLTRSHGSGWAFWNAQWSPDGSQLAFLGGDDGAHDVWIIDADGSRERNLSNTPGDDWWPSWSPDGSRIAVVESATPGSEGHFMVVNRDGTDPVSLEGPGVDGNLPVWSPDGTKLFGFLSDRTDYPHFMWGLIHGVHGGIVIYDAIGKTGPTIIASADDGTWQRLAP